MTSPKVGDSGRPVSRLDGSTSTYQFDGVVFKLTNAGTWKGDQSVKQKLEFFATTRKRV